MEGWCCGGAFGESCCEGRTTWFDWERIGGSATRGAVVCQMDMTYGCYGALVVDLRDGVLGQGGEFMLAAICSSTCSTP